MEISMTDVLEMIAGNNPALFKVVIKISSEVAKLEKQLEDYRSQSKHDIDELRYLNEELGVIRDQLFDAEKELADIKDAEAHVTAHCEYCPGVDESHGPHEEEFMYEAIQPNDNDDVPF